jgi:hypothetical protein
VLVSFMCNHQHNQQPRISNVKTNTITHVHVLFNYLPVFHHALAITIVSYGLKDRIESKSVEDSEANLSGMTEGTF